MNSAEGNDNAESDENNADIESVDGEEVDSDNGNDVLHIDEAVSLKIVTLSTSSNRSQSTITVNPFTVM